jgi:hypothetical protein
MTIEVTSAVQSPVGTYVVSPKVFDTAAPTYSASAQVKYSVANSGSSGTFSDDFNRADAEALGNRWVVAPGKYAIRAGMAVAQAASSLAVQESVSGGTQSAQAAFIRPTSASGTRFGVVVRYQDPRNYYVCYRQVGGSSQWKISKVVNGVERLLKAASVPQTPSRPRSRCRAPRAAT